MLFKARPSTKILWLLCLKANTDTVRQAFAQLPKRVHTSDRRSPRERLLRQKSAGAQVNGAG
jgi:hypothetical protein